MRQILSVAAMLALASVIWAQPGPPRDRSGQAGFGPGRFRGPDLDRGGRGSMARRSGSDIAELKSELETLKDRLAALEAKLRVRERGGMDRVARRGPRSPQSSLGRGFAPWGAAHFGYWPMRMSAGGFGASFGPPPRNRMAGRTDHRGPRFGMPDLMRRLDRIQAELDGIRRELMGRGR